MLGSVAPGPSTTTATVTTTTTAPVAKVDVRVVTWNVLSSSLCEPSYYTLNNPMDLDPTVRLKRVLDKLDFYAPVLPPSGGGGSGGDAALRSVVCLQEGKVQYASAPIPLSISNSPTTFAGCLAAAGSTTNKQTHTHTHHARAHTQYRFCGPARCSPGSASAGTPSCLRTMAGGRMGTWAWAWRCRASASCWRAPTCSASPTRATGRATRRSPCRRR